MILIHEVFGNTHYLGYSYCNIQLKIKEYPFRKFILVKEKQTEKKIHKKIKSVTYLHVTSSQTTDIQRFVYWSVILVDTSPEYLSQPWLGLAWYTDFTKILYSFTVVLLESV